MVRLPLPFGKDKAAPLLRWLFTLFGGVLMGVGLLLWGQSMLVTEIKDQVQSSFFLFRWIGSISFVFLATDTQTFLALAEVPDKPIQESIRWGKGLMILGACFPLVSLFLRSKVGKVKKKKKAKKK